MSKFHAGEIAVQERVGVRTRLSFQSLNAGGGC